jgi:membrane associated rhomboid family serine protease
VNERQPIVNAPGVVVGLLALFVVIHLVRVQLLSEVQDARLVELLAFIPARLSSVGPELYGDGTAAFTQFVTHAFLHGDITHLLVNSAWFLAFGTSVARRTGAGRFLLFFLLCAVGGALCYLAFNVGSYNPMIGASGAISGLMGAAFRFLLPALNDGDHDGIAGEIRQPPLLSLWATFSNRRILAFIAGWTVLNILMALGASGLLDGVSIAWEAHVGGFYMGLLGFGLFDGRLADVHQDVAGAE